MIIIRWICSKPYLRIMYSIVLDLVSTNIKCIMLIFQLWYLRLYDFQKVLSMPIFQFVQLIFSNLTKKILFTFLKIDWFTGNATLIPRFTMKMNKVDITWSFWIYGQFYRKQLHQWIQNIRGYYDRGKKCRQFKLLIWTSLNGQFVHKVGGKGKG